MVDLILDDCMNVMKDYEDNHFDLAIVDPPYGISYARGKHGLGVCENRPKLSDVSWDKSVPKKEYFDQLFRVSKNQIIWGGNYFTDNIPVSKCWIIWNKINNTENKSVFADGELAWTSFNKVVKMFTLRTLGFINDTKYKERIHPTQKPVELYEWLLHNYAEKGQKILDTHLGSGSIAIASHYFGVDLVGVEIDEEYYNKAKQRIEDLTKQETLW